MKIFVESANFREIKKWMVPGTVDGVATNPSIMLNGSVYDIDGARQLSTLLR